jgi:hypothetical protein
MTEHPRYDAPRLGSAQSAEEANDGDRPFLPTRTIAAPASALAFWSAIALPALYIPLLFTGLSTVPDLALFLGLFGLHLVALVGGQSYRRD